MPKISILVVDDHMIVREGLKAALSAEQDMEVVGEAEDGKQAINIAKQTSPDVVIMLRTAGIPLCRDEALS